MLCNNLTVNCTTRKFRLYLRSWSSHIDAALAFALDESSLCNSSTSIPTKWQFGDMSSCASHLLLSGDINLCPSLWSCCCHPFSLPDTAPTSPYLLHLCHILHHNIWSLLLIFHLSLTSDTSKKHIGSSQFIPTLCETETAKTFRI